MSLSLLSRIMGENSKSKIGGMQIPLFYSCGNTVFYAFLCTAYSSLFKTHANEN